MRIDAGIGSIRKIGNLDKIIIFKKEKSLATIKISVLNVGYVI